MFQKKYLLFCFFLLPLSVFAQINESDTLTFQGRLALTGAWQAGNVEMLTSRGKLEISASAKQKWVFKTQNSYLYQEFFKKKADEDLFSRNFIYYNPHKVVYPFAMAFVSTNFRREIDFRYFAGLGLTWQIFKKEQHLIKIALSGVYESTKFNKIVFNQNNYNNHDKIDTWRGTFWLFGKHFLLDKKLIFHYDCYAQPSVEKNDNFRWQADVGLDVPLYKGFNFTTNLLYTYESIVVINQKTEDILLTFGLSYHIKK